MIERATVRTAGMNMDGAAEGEAGGKLFLVWGGLPGELLEVRVYGRRKKRYLSYPLQVLEPGEHRREPLEDHYYTCSPWQVLDPAAEERFKRERLRELLERRAGFDLGSFAMYQGKYTAYRNKMEYSFLYEDFSPAFFLRGSRRKTAVPRGCVLAKEEINSVALALRDFLRDEGVDPRAVKTLTLRCNSKGEVLASLFVKEEDFALKHEPGTVPGLAGWRIFYSDPRSPASVPTRMLWSTGESHLVEEVLGKKLLLTDLTFFQVNLEAFERALEDIRAFTAGTNLLYDMYAGVGTIGITAGAKRTILVEEGEESAQGARANIRLNGTPDVEVYCSRVEDFIAAASEKAVYVFDPPRQGLHKKVIRELRSKRPRRLVYLSCNPVTQAENLFWLKDLYRLTFFRAYNFFPRTPHVETLAVMDLRVSH